MSDSAAPPRALDDRYRVTDGLVHLTGVQALARLPLDARRADVRAGLRTAAFVSGYEGSPLGGYDLELGRQAALLAEHDVVFRPGVNEELAATAVQGAQLAARSADRRVDGVTGYWYGKSPGLDRAADALRHNTLMGTTRAGGAVAFVGDDPAAKSSTLPGCSEPLLADLGMPVLYPADPQEVLDLGLHAVALSRISGLWVGFKIATNVADGTGTAQVHPERVVPVFPDPTIDGRPFTHEVTARMLQPELGRLERSRDGARLELARRYAAANPLNRIVASGPDDRIGIVACGKTFLDLREGLRLLGLDDAELARRGVRLLRLGLVHPLEPGIVHRFAEGLREIVVVEEKRSFVETALKDLLYGRTGAPAIHGKRGPDGSALLPADGELDPDVIAGALAGRLTALGDFPSVIAWVQGRRKPRGRITLPLATRTPYFCSGCPHNSSTKTPEGSLVGAGIGCHSLVLMMDTAGTGEITGVTQMGGEGAQWVGMAPFLSRDHLLQNLGDGTFHHSGSLAVRAAVAGGVNITYKLLYNSAVAMTGGQQPAGVMTIPQITHAMRSEGVRRIIVTTEDPRRYRRAGLAKGVQVWSRDRLTEAQEVLARTEGVTLLIHDQECATELRRKRKRGLAPEPPQRIVINERVCEGCGDCGAKSNCLSVQPVATEFGRKTRIDQSSCNKDFSCLDGDCPSFLTVLPGKRAVTARRATPIADAFADPVPVFGTERFTARITGVGGSGVVTLSQILSTAATIAGLPVRALDQTGLAQKGGAVVSDIRIGDVAANKATAETCDLYLGADILVAADPRQLAVAAPGRTAAVVSTAQVPTGAMVTDTAAAFPDVTELLDRIGSATDPRTVQALDARAVSETLFGQDQYANLLLTGIAYQRGALPIPASAVEEAITLNGTKAETNIQAFRRGRQFVADRAAFDSTVRELRGEPEPPAEPAARVRALLERVRADAGSELARLLAIRVPDLVAYQNLAYARRYVEDIERLRRAEAAAVPGSTALTEAAAHHLHKLMAYKDEYEVARLSLDPGQEREIRARYGADARIAFRLHPPVLRAMGMRRKLELGPWFRPVFAALVAARQLRGTPFDPFGRAAVRRTERALVAEYRAVLAELGHSVRPENHDLAVEIASLPDAVRGYEDIKLGNVAAYRAALAEALKRFRAPVKAGEPC
ncbi:indolepyruvate ferredoxin oxidoreductase family protein [Amycolatopsis eburnea]|uniref:Indolepyruvate ferredoxin oxidoreductase family protein n=1 Tax=Amycolatopsis eburnea TaxID=2267691 RepID=A0A427SYV3_9PSEU|nr:indolepyruvate ferredoxin oxidoreductase family protein [Amycolatopsis eburnea]RSD10245.1 indolepyruvate ferredoxin oxidoreductase family protein [Amycolatopsis eburnea]